MRQANRRSTVTTRLPSTLARYFTATNSHDVDGMLVLFADGAVVKDEGREYRRHEFTLEDEEIVHLEIGS